jgi:pyruvate dehydrogenase E1 component beta subunit
MLAPVARVSGWDVHTPLYRLEMKQLPSTARVVDAAKRTLAAG